jgi:FKBP-type peptidyl-prolyl cis-trans isomerase SlyD
VITHDKVVWLNFTLRDDEGTVLDTSDGREPLAYLHGHHNIVPGLEKALEGLEVGAKLIAKVTPEEGFGPREGEPVEVPRDAFPPDADIHVGAAFHAQDDNGEVGVLWVVDVSDAMVVVDKNHPLAGMALNFDVEILGVRDANPEELRHGHPHGIDGSETHGHSHGHD